MNVDKIRKITELGYNVDKDGIVYKPNGGIQRTHINNQGYKCFGLKIKGKSFQIPVHRLQAYCLYGESMFEERIVVRHLDGNPLNNKSNNIAIGTISQNSMDIPSEKRLEIALKGVEAARLVNIKHDYNTIRNDRSNGMTYKEIMKKHNISSKGTLSYIINS